MGNLHPSEALENWVADERARLAAIKMEEEPKVAMREAEQAAAISKAADADERRRKVVLRHLSHALMDIEGRDPGDAVKSIRSAVRALVLTSIPHHECARSMCLALGMLSQTNAADGDWDEPDYQQAELEVLRAYGAIQRPGDKGPYELMNERMN